MTLLNTLNVGGTDFGILNNTVMGVCTTPAGSEVKACSFADNFELKAGVIVTVKFTYANTYGNGSTTYPKLTVNGVTGAIRNVTGEYASNGAWNNQALVPFLFDGTDFTLLITNVTDTVALNNKYSVSSDAVANKVLYTRDFLSTLRSTTYWAAYLPKFAVFERRGVAGKTIEMELGIYRYITDFHIQISYGSADAILQQALGEGRTDFISIQPSTQYDDIKYECKTYILTIQIPANASILGIRSDTDIFFYNYREVGA